MTWIVEMLNGAVEGELLALPVDMQARFLRVSELLTESGPEHVGMPHVRPLGNRLWEMRLAGRAGIGRAIYVATHEQRLIVLRAFVKKSQRTRRKDIDIALRRMRGMGL